MTFEHGIDSIVMNTSNELCRYMKFKTIQRLHCKSKFEISNLCIMLGLAFAYEAFVPESNV